MTNRKTVEIECPDCGGTGEADNDHPDEDGFELMDCLTCKGKGWIVTAEDDL